MDNTPWRTSVPADGTCEVKPLLWKVQWESASFDCYYENINLSI